MLHTEEQIERCELPTETQSTPQSKESMRGGKRPGAGRRPNLAKQLLKGFTPATIALAVQDMDVREVLMGLLKSKSERVRLETLAFLRDTLYGRPAQNLSLSGGVNVNMAVWRPLENLSDQEIQLLDSITKKLNGPASNASQDGPHNQIESKPAIEAEVVESEAVND